MPSYLDIEDLCWEIGNLINNNYTKGTKTQRFKKAEKDILESVKKAIRENKEDILNEVV